MYDIEVIKILTKYKLTPFLTYLTVVTIKLKVVTVSGNRNRMDSYNQSIGESFSSNITYSEEVPMFVTYLNMVVILMVTTVIIYPAVIVINIIWKTRELHTKYFFFVANLLTTDIIAILTRSTMQYLIMILYLLGLNTESVFIVLKLLVFPMHRLIQLMAIMLPITLAIERMIVINFPYRHRSIMTTKTAIGILAMMWSLLFILTIIITFVVPVDIVWPLALINYHSNIIPFFVLPRLTSAAFIVAANVFLQYKVIMSNRKAKENERLGNEEEKQFQKLVQLLRAQVKPTITLLLVGGIDVLGNILISLMYPIIGFSVQSSMAVYLEQFLMYPMTTSLLVAHPLVYGLYMRKIRDRLPRCMACQGRWIIRNSEVTTLHQQPQVM